MEKTHLFDKTSLTVSHRETVQVEGQPVEVGTSWSFNAEQAAKHAVMFESDMSASEKTKLAAFKTASQVKAVKGA